MPPPSTPHETGPVVYLAGPDVFHADSARIGAAKKRFCYDLGLQPIYPGDTTLIDRADLSPSEIAVALYEENVAHIDRAAGVLANLSPFRGPNADDGTAFEVGYAVAKGKVVIAYDDGAPGVGSGDLRGKTERFRAAAPALEDRYAIIEDFGEAANLMLACSIAEPIRTDDFEAAPGDLTRFEAAARAIAARLLR